MDFLFFTSHFPEICRKKCYKSVKTKKGLQITFFVTQYRKKCRKNAISSKIYYFYPNASALTAIERTRGFLEAAQLSKDWVAKMQDRALILEAHHTTHIDGTHLSLDQSERLIAGEKISLSIGL